MRNTVYILLALALGLGLPGLAVATPIIRPNLMLMLFFSLLGVPLDRRLLGLRQGLAALLLPALGLGAYHAAAGLGETVALNLFVIVLAPTAIVAPVLARLAGRDVGYTVGGILLTTVGWAVSLPLLLPLVTERGPGVGELLGLFGTVGMTIGLPLLLAQSVRRWATGGLRRRLEWLAKYTLLLFTVNVCVAASNLSAYLRESPVAPGVIGLTAGLTAGAGLLLFALGAGAGPRGQRFESSLVLGRKNTMLSIWMALEYLTPLATLAPMVYILFQNVLFAGQLAWLRQKGGGI